MSQPKRPYEQIPYPTGSDATPEQPAAEEPEVPAEGQPPPLPPEWPDAPPTSQWSPDAEPASQWSATPQPVSPWSPEAPPVGVWSPDSLPGAQWPPAPPPAAAPDQPATTPDRPASTPDRPATTARNPWKWVAAGLAVLLAIVVAAVVGRVTAPSQAGQGSAQAAPSQDSGPSSGQGPLFTPEPGTPQPSPDTFNPKPGSAPTFYSGRGNAVVPITKDPGSAIVAFECDKCTGNTVLKSDGSGSVLVNTIGPYSGRRPIDLQESSHTTTITVGATSDWRMTVSSGLTAARSGEAGASMTGQGDDVVIMNGSTTTARVTNSGAGGFIVYVVPVRSATVDVAVNSTGAYDGTISLPSPALVIVQSTGSWSITPS